ncbi:MAG TPA: HAMP domain-containing sensor histidine kinase [Steroidobacteraceae bacterium]|nr:HAMP domain-containing sensor histidine kinase [Steroidobacteraceae bacterium]
MKQRTLHYSSTRLAIIYVGLCALCVGALLWVGFLFTARGLTREVDLVIAAELDGLKDEYDQGGLARLVATLNRRTDSWGSSGAVYLLVDAANHKIAGNLSGWPLQPRVTQGWVEFDITARDRSGRTDHPVRAEIYALGAYRLLVGTDVSERRNIAARLRDTTLWGIALAALLSAAIGWWYSRRVASRVRQVAQTCEKIISDDLTQRLPQSGSRNEFDQLAGAVNHMLDRIEQQTTTLRATFNSAAHDLRSPLHRMRVRLESAVSRVPLEHAARSAVEDTISDLERVQRTLATLLQIAQANSANALRGGEAVDLAALGQELGELYDPEARERGLELTVHARGPVSVSGNRQLLAQLMANLLENAIKYVPAGGRIGLTVEATPTLASLIVSDNGPGIALESVGATPRATSSHSRPRWTSSATDPPGSGLGLSLVAAVVRMHRGRLALWDNEPGLMVRCDFPAVTALS